MKPTPRRKWYLTTGRSFHEMVLDPIPQSLSVHFFGSRPQPPTSPLYPRANSPNNEGSFTSKEPSTQFEWCPPTRGRQDTIGPGVYPSSARLFLSFFLSLFLSFGLDSVDLSLPSDSEHTATHCNTLQHTATHCNTLQHTATHCNTPVSPLTRNTTHRDQGLNDSRLLGDHD